MQLLSATRQNSGGFIFQQDCPALRNTLFSDINISQRSVVTRFRCGGIFNDSSIANFQEIVKLKKKIENWPVFDEVMPKILLLRFFPDTVYFRL